MSSAAVPRPKVQVAEDDEHSTLAVQQFRSLAGLGKQSFVILPGDFQDSQNRVGARPRQGTQFLREFLKGDICPQGKSEIAFGLSGSRQGRVALLLHTP